MTYRHVLVTRSDDRHVVTVTLNRPEQMNAMNTAMGEDLLACFTALAADPDARAVVFTGSGEKAFCAGGDLKERNEMSDEQWRAQHVIFEQGAMRLLRCPIPVIAAVEGFALAGGCELAILSDFVVAGETAVFGVPETTLGIFPGIGGTQLLPRIVGAPLAKELIFTGRRMKAEEAKRRYDMSLVKQDPFYFYIEIGARFPADKADFQQARLVLWRKSFLPRQLWFEQPNGLVVQSCHGAIAWYMPGTHC